MNELYGYKEKDVIGLIGYMKDKKCAKNIIFRGYAELSGKSVGTIRNLYYQIVKLSNSSAEFCNKYLGGKPLSSNKIEFFDCAEEREIIKKILLLKAEGYSVRKAINQITSGDSKLALRYQNKYRDISKNNPALLSSVVKELKAQNPSINLCVTEKVESNSIGLSRLKTEINFLYERLFSNILNESRALKRRNQELELENARLTELSIKGIKGATALDYFKDIDGNGAVN